MIKFVGVSSTAANSTSLPSGVKKGDLLLVFAYRTGSSSPPTAPSGWNVVLSGGGGSGGNRNALIVGWRFYDGTFSNTGTWTNAVRVVCAAYRGVYHAAPVGSAQQSGGTSTSVTYRGLTLSPSSWGSSLVVCFGATVTSTSVETPPSGTKLRANYTATHEVALFDTAAGVSTWTQKSVTVSGSNVGWRTAVLELRRGIEGSIQFVGATSGTSSASLPPGWSADDVAIVFAYRMESPTDADDIIAPSGWTVARSTNRCICRSGEVARVAKMGYRVLVSGDTDTGTWSGADFVVCMVYRGVHPFDPVINSSSGCCGYHYSVTTDGMLPHDSWWGVFHAVNTSANIPVPTYCTERIAVNNQSPPCSIKAFDTGGPAGQIDPIYNVDGIGPCAQRMSFNSYVVDKLEGAGFVFALNPAQPNPFLSAREARSKTSGGPLLSPTSKKGPILVGTSTGGSSLTLPSGWQPGDVAFIVARNSTGGSTTPSGFSGIYVYPPGATSYKFGVSYRVLQPGDSSTVTGQSGTSEMACVVYRNVSSPVEHLLAEVVSSQTRFENFDGREIGIADPAVFFTTSENDAFFLSAVFCLENNSTSKTGAGNLSSPPDPYVCTVSHPSNRIAFWDTSGQPRDSTTYENIDMGVILTGHIVTFQLIPASTKYMDVESGAVRSVGFRTDEPEAVEIVGHVTTASLELTTRYTTHVEVLQLPPGTLPGDILILAVPPYVSGSFSQAISPIIIRHALLSEWNLAPLKLFNSDTAFPPPWSSVAWKVITDHDIKSGIKIVGRRAPPRAPGSGQGRNVQLASGIVVRGTDHAPILDTEVWHGTSNSGSSVQYQAMKSVGPNVPGNLCIRTTQTYYYRGTSEAPITPPAPADPGYTVAGHAAYPYKQYWIYVALHARQGVEQLPQENATFTHPSPVTVLHNSVTYTFEVRALSAWTWGYQSDENPVVNFLPSAATIVSGVVDVEPVPVSITGISSPVVRAFLVEKSAGSHTYSGSGVNSFISSVIQALLNTGAYISEGLAAISLKDLYSLPSSGSYLAQGEPKRLLRHLMSEEFPGSYGVAGHSQHTLIAFVVQKTPGGYVILGIGQSVATNLLTQANQGSYLTVGELLEAARTTAILVVQLPGDYSSYGPDARTLRDTYAPQAPGSYLITDIPAEVLYRFLSDVSAGAHSVNGIPTEVLIGIRQLVEILSGTYATTGSNADATRLLLVLWSAGAYEHAGSTSAPEKSMQSTQTPGTYTLSGDYAELLKQLDVRGSVGVYLLSGVQTELSKSLGARGSVGVYLLSGSNTELSKALDVRGSIGLYSVVGTATGAALDLLAEFVHGIVQKSGFPVEVLIARPEATELSAGYYVTEGIVTRALLDRLSRLGAYSIIVSGGETSVGRGTTLFAAHAAYVVSGEFVLETVGRTINVTPGSVVLLGKNVQVTGKETETGGHIRIIVKASRLPHSVAAKTASTRVRAKPKVDA